MIHCPYCNEIVLGTNAWISVEQDEERGILCPECEEFISNKEIAQMDNDDKTFTMTDIERAMIAVDTQCKRNEHPIAATRWRAMVLDELKK